MSLKEDMLCEGTIKKKGPGFFFPEKNNSTGYFFFYILPNWFKYKKAMIVICPKLFASLEWTTLYRNKKSLKPFVLSASDLSREL
jgi:hypothetical protein